MKAKELPKVKRYRSSIPKGSIERVVRPFRQEGACVWMKQTECLFDGVVVGHRFYDEDGSIESEVPLRDGLKHGVQFTWYDGKRLASAEPFHKGLPHGVASQWDYDGVLLGTYTLHHGTGLDLWRMGACDDFPAGLAEVLSLRDGEPHGFTWWLNPDQCSVFFESHCQEGQPHGIERMWNSQGRLRRGFPKYFVKGERVDKREYMKACLTDPTLPIFQEKDNEPQRSFPAEIAKELGPKSQS